MTSKRPQRTPNRWKCGHCGAEGWGQHRPHDKDNGQPCRASGMKTEREISRAAIAETNGDWLQRLGLTGKHLKEARRILMKAGTS